MRVILSQLCIAAGLLALLIWFSEPWPVMGLDSASCSGGYVVPEFNLGQTSLGTPYFDWSLQWNCTQYVSAPPKGQWANKVWYEPAPAYPEGY